MRSCENLSGLASARIARAAAVDLKKVPEHDWPHHGAKSQDRNHRATGFEKPLPKSKTKLVLEGNCALISASGALPGLLIKTPPQNLGNGTTAPPRIVSHGALAQQPQALPHVATTASLCIRSQTRRAAAHSLLSSAISASFFAEYWSSHPVVLCGPIIKITGLSVPARPPSTQD